MVNKVCHRERAAAMGCFTHILAPDRGHERIEQEGTEETENSFRSPSSPFAPVESGGSFLVSLAKPRGHQSDFRGDWAIK